MKYALLLVLFIYSFGLQAQVASPQDIQFAQYEYNKHIKAADHARDAALAGIILGGIGLVLNHASTQNLNYDTSFLRGASTTFLVVGSATVVLGTYSFIGHKTKARRIEKKFSF